jgi:hypothetical protein
VEIAQQPVAMRNMLDLQSLEYLQQLARQSRPATETFMHGHRSALPLDMPRAQSDVSLRDSKMHLKKRPLHEG